MVIEGRLLLSKALRPIMVTVFGICIEFRLLQSLKARFPMFVTPLSMITVIMDVWRFSNLHGASPALEFQKSAILPLPLILNVLPLSSAVTLFPDVELSLIFHVCPTAVLAKAQRHKTMRKQILPVPFLKWFLLSILALLFKVNSVFISLVSFFMINRLVISLLFVIEAVAKSRSGAFDSFLLSEFNPSG
jgi:hypothetical protein